MLARYIKQREAQSTIAAIRTEGGAVTRDPTEINKIFREFYATLYSSETQVDQQEMHAFLTSLTLPTLSVDQVDLLDAPITKEEIVDVIEAFHLARRQAQMASRLNFLRCMLRNSPLYFCKCIVRHWIRAAYPPLCLRH